MSISYQLHVVHVDGRDKPVIYFRYLCAYTRLFNVFALVVVFYSANATTEQL